MYANLQRGSAVATACCADQPGACLLPLLLRLPRLLWLLETRGCLSPAHLLCASRARMQCFPDPPCLAPIPLCSHHPHHRPRFHLLRRGQQVHCAPGLEWQLPCRDGSPAILSSCNASYSPPLLHSALQFNAHVTPILTRKSLAENAEHPFNMHSDIPAYLCIACHPAALQPLPLCIALPCYQPTPLRTHKRTRGWM